jgi:hypothetical protein
MNEPQFEFTPKQDIEFRELVAKEQIAAIAIGALMVFKLIAGLSSGLPSLNWQAAVLLLASFAAGIYSCFALYGSSRKLYRITQSNGKDLKHLFAGLQGLENCFVALALSILFGVVADYMGG